MRTVCGTLTGLILMLGAADLGGAGRSLPDEEHWSRLRDEMVRSQIEARGVRDPKVLAAMRTVPRHRFVPSSQRSQAYDDHPLSIGHGQTISQPYIVALMSEALQPDSSMRVLEIGTGSGYQAAVLARIVDSVYTVEIVDELAQSAAKLLSESGCGNVSVRSGDGYQGWVEHAPYDAIIVTCAPTQVPQPLVDQLKEGGRMVIPVGGQYAQELVLLTKRNGAVVRTNIIAVRFVPMMKPDGREY